MGYDPDPARLDHGLQKSHLSRRRWRVHLAFNSNESPFVREANEIRTAGIANPVTDVALADAITADVVAKQAPAQLTGFELAFAHEPGFFIHATCLNFFAWRAFRIMAAHA